MMPCPEAMGWQFGDFEKEVSWVSRVFANGPEAEVQSEVESYQRLEKWYLIPPCLTLSITRYVSRVKWSNPGKGIAPYPTPQWNNYWKGSLWVTFNYSRHHHHHHHVVPLAGIFLIFSRHFSLSFIASGRSSGLHPLSSHSRCMYVRAGRPAFARPYVGLYRSTSLMSSSLLLQQCPACLVCLTWIVFVMGGRWPYSWCLVGCCHQDLYNIARNILV